MGEILQNRYAAFRRCLALLLSVVMVLSTMTFTTAVAETSTGDTITLGGNTYTVASVNDSSMSITSATVGLNDNDTLSDGDTFNVTLEFNISNVSTDFGNGTDGYVVFQEEIEGLKNITFTDTDWLSFTKESTGVTGYWRLYTDSNGKTYVQVVVTSATNAESNISGNMTIKATVNEIKEDDTKNGGSEIEIGFTTGTTTISKTYTYNNPSTLVVKKSATGNATYDSGTDSYIQAWTVTISASNGGYIDIASISDTMSNMSLTGSITMSGTSEGTSINGTYSDMDTLSAALANKILNSGETITITYYTTTTRSAAEAASNYVSGSDLKNTVTVKETDGTEKSSSAYMSANVPKAEKGYSVDTNTGKITWTIKIYWVGMFTGDAAADSSYVSTWSDTYTVGGTADNNTYVTDPFTGSGWTYNYDQYNSGSCYWYYTYTTDIDDSVNLSAVDYSNTFTATVAGTEISANKTYTDPAEGVVTKAAGTRDASGYIDWTVTFTVPYDNFDLSTLKLTDTVGSGHSYVDLTSATLTSNGSSPSIYSYVTATPSNGNQTVEFTFSSYTTNLNAGDLITLVYRTQDTSSPLSENITYKNTVTATFDSYTQTTSAELVESSVDALTKNSNYQTSDTSYYNLTIDLAQLDKAGVSYTDGFKIYDQLSLVGDDLISAFEQFKADTGKTFADAFTIGNISCSNATVTATDIEDDGKMTFTVTNVTNGSTSVYITYTITISDAFTPYLLAINGTSATNYIYNYAKLYAVSGSDETEVGDDDANAYPAWEVLNTSTFVDKTYAYASEINDTSAEYVSSTGDTVVYTLSVNTNGLSLSTGSTITLVDKLGSGLALWSDQDVASGTNTKLSSAVTVYECQKVYMSNDWYVENWVELSNNVDYTYEYDASTNTISFTVPDSIQIKIVYYCQVTLTNGTQVTDELTNNVYLTGYSSYSAGSDSANLGATYLSTSYITGDSATFTLNKYSSSPNQSSDPIYGATFELTPIDPTTGQAYVDTNRYEKKTMTVTESGSTVELLYDTLYKVVETAAPSGYECSTDVYYIWIRSSTNTTGITIPTGIDSSDVYEVTETTSGVYTRSYYDEPSNQLTISKFETGASTQLEDAEFTLSFVASTSGDTLANVVSDGTFTYNGTDDTISFTTTTSAITFYGLPDGDYTLTETSAPSSSYIALDADITFTVSSGEISGFTTNSTTGSITADGTATEAKLAVYNDVSGTPTAQASITVNKVDSENTSIYLSEADLVLTADDTTVNLALTVTDVTGAKDNSVTISGNTIKFTTDGTSVGIVGLPEGDYTLSEDTAPDGYDTAPSITFSISVADDGTATITETNTSGNISGSTVTMKDEKSKVDINISKQIADGSNLSGAVLTLTSVDGYDISGATVNNATDVDKTTSTVIKFTTTANDDVEIENLPQGTYILHEETAPSGYITADNIEFEVTITSGTTTITCTNASAVSGTTVKMVDQEKGTVIISKKDITDANAVTELAGATLKLTNTNNTDLSGVTVSGGTKDDTQSTGNVLVFETGSSETVLKDLPDGNYTLEETAAPDGYDTADTITFAVSTETDGSRTVTIGTTTYGNTVTMNDKKLTADISLSKQDYDDGTALAGASFTLKSTTSADLSGVVITNRQYFDGDEASTGTIYFITSDNTLSISNLPQGTYTLEETDAPNGYSNENLINITFTVTVTGGYSVVTITDIGTYSDYVSVNTSDASEIIVKNKLALASISISKQDSETSAVLDGAVFTLTSTSGADLSNLSYTNVAAVDDTYADTGVVVITMSSGAMGISDLPQGDYTLVETTAPDGYDTLGSTIEFTVKVTGGNTVVNITSTSNLVYVDSNDNANIIVENEKSLGEVTISKVGLSDQTTNLGGAELTLTSEDGYDLSSVDVSNYTGTVDKTNASTGVIVFVTSDVASTISKLPQGSYSLAETKAPDGYDTAEIINFTVKVSGGNTVITKQVTNGTETVSQIQMIDYPLAQIKIHKVTTDDNGNDVNVSGVTFTIYDANKGYIEEIVTGTDGWASTANTYAKGTYYIKETDTTDGSYILLDNYYKVTIGYNTTDITISIVGDSKVSITSNEIKVYNDQTEVTINKVDDNGDALAGAEFQILDANNNVVDSWTSDGTVHTVKGILETGKTYTLHEVSAPEGYVTADDVTIILDRDGNITSPSTATYTGNVVTVTNKYAAKQIEIKVYKVDENGKPLAGVTFGIYSDSTCTTEVDRITTDSTGYAVSADTYVVGTYYVKEIKAADGYKLSTNVYKAVVSQDKTNITIVIKDGDDNEVSFITNYETSVSISKVDIADGEELAGATIQIIDSNGDVVEEWISTDTPHEVTGLKTGEEYTLREKVAPTGYEIATDTTFVLDEYGEIDKSKTTTTVSDSGVLLVEDAAIVEPTTEAPTTEAPTTEAPETTTEAPETTTEAPETTTEAPETTTAAPETTTEAEETTTAALETTTEAPETTTTTVAEETITEAETTTEAEATTEAEETTTVSEADSNLIVEVLDEETGEPVEGAVVRITDANGNYVDLVTGKDGKVYGDFEIGDYTIEVVEVPDGYTVTVGQKTTVTLVENEVAEHQAKVTKLDGGQLGDSDSGILPITGMLVWPISVLSILGALFMVGGVIDNKRRRTK